MDLDMPVIYKARNKVNNKVYIGFATNFLKRRNDHRCGAKNKNHNQYFYNAINKYGWENFEWEILKEDAKIEDEAYFIELFESYYEYGKGYNLTKGGEGKYGYKTSEQTRKKISNTMKKKQVTERQVEILRENAKRMKGVPRPQEIKDQISLSNKGRKLTDEHRLNISKNHAAHRESGSFYSSLEYKTKMSNSLRGKKRTPEQIERYREAAIKRHKNKKMQVQGF